MIKKNNKHWEYEMKNLGYNFRLPDINCALGISQLIKLKKFIKKRRKIANIYDSFFSDKKFIIILRQKIT